MRDPKNEGLTAFVKGSGHSPLRPGEGRGAGLPKAAGLRDPSWEATAAAQVSTGELCGWRSHLGLAYPAPPHAECWAEEGGRCGEREGSRRKGPQWGGPPSRCLDALD